MGISDFTAGVKNITSNVDGFTSALNFNPSAPSSQKDLPISFYFSNWNTQAKQNVVLPIRPEDMTLTKPERLAVQQTLGGAWVDHFGLGLENLIINGHTGWRGGQGQDGVAQFAALDGVFARWRKERQDAIAAGQDVSLVSLFYLDSLNNQCLRIAPISFTLKRNKSRPLLMMYQINALVIKDVNAEMPPVPDLGAGLDSLGGTIGKLIRMAGNVANWIQTNLVGPVQAIMNLTSSVLGAVQAVRGVITKDLAPIVNLGRDLCQAGRNIMQTFAAVAGIPQMIKAQLMGAASEFNNALCLLNNVFHVQLAYPNYDAIYGASNCSSTSGGRPLSPLANQNPFSLIFTGGGSAYKVSNAARSSLDVMKKTDVALNPISVSAMTPHLTNIAGITAA